MRDDATARLDAAMVLVDVDVDLEALGRRGVEKGCDLALQTGWFSFTAARSRPRCP